MADPQITPKDVSKLTKEEKDKIRLEALAAGAAPVKAYETAAAEEDKMDDALRIKYHKELKAHIIGYLQGVSSEKRSALIGKGLSEQEFKKKVEEISKEFDADIKKYKDMKPGEISISPIVLSDEDNEKLGDARKKRYYADQDARTAIFKVFEKYGLNYDPKAPADDTEKQRRNNNFEFYKEIRKGLEKPADKAIDKNSMFLKPSATPVVENDIVVAI